ncbi:MAG: protein kinase [Acidobacteriia bacterium]|nr:protein kinase [Terriglobia bacterium]
MLSRYKILGKLGAGGMGVVYRAEDLTLKRSVALKLITGTLREEEHARARFLREARVSAALNHPNVCVIFDFGEVQPGEEAALGGAERLRPGTPFISMELVEGRTLAAMLRERRPLRFREMIDIAIQVVGGLAAAHAKGVIHRDLKPGNVMVAPDGRAKILDFGLAKPRPAIASEDAGTTTTTTLPRDLTTEGKIVGTMAYMSPEQARGMPLDSRSDVFSFGTMLYEMATGKHPFASDDPVATLGKILEAEPEPLENVAPASPPELDQIVRRCLRKRPDDRYNDTRDLVIALEELIRDTAAGARTASESARTIMVWPLAVHGRPQGGEILGTVFARQLANELAQTTGLEVLPVPAAARPGEEDAVSRARGLGAGRLLIGTVGTSARAVDVTISLVDASRNRLLWGATRQAAEREIRSLASGIARDVLGRLGYAAPHVYDLLESMPIENPKLAVSPSWSEVLATALDSKTTEQTVQRARALARKFPSEPLVLALLAFICLDVFAAMRTDENLRQLEIALQGLEELDRRSPYAASIRASALGFQGKTHDAIALYDGLCAREDLSTSLKSRYLADRALLRAREADVDGASSDFEKAQRLAPVDYYVALEYARFLKSQKRPEEALSWALRAQALAWHDGHTQALVGQILSELHRWDESVAPNRMACELLHRQALCAELATSLLMSGHSAEAAEAAHMAEGLTDNASGQACLGRYNSRAGNKSEALRCLRRSVALGFSNTSWLREDEGLAPLRGDPEFESIIAETESHRARK